ncbi:hypothetical protein [Archangium gephyra]|uniref:Uncharacterized protein n=1 Tax=Archangium gephyra TaxID=48 RepID=A0AAC8Q3C4_9BACT|nr:hypothetical protein [Archangium gephyra]AKJ00127.1 Hypothetical protein AA314_01753 [Archangium gephyra]
MRNVALEAAWAEDTRVLAADGSLARVELNGEGTRVLRLSGFSIALPAGTTITGATVRVTGRTPTAATGLTAMVRFGRTTFAQTSPERTGVAFTTSSEVHALFGPGVRWSGSLTRNLAMVSNFAMDLGFQGPAATVLEVDHVTLELLYREGTVDKTTGPLSPTVVTQASLARQWLSTDSALTVDGDPALVDAMVDHELTARLESSGYGFELPDDAAVVGIRVDVTRGSLNSEGVRDLDLRLLKNGAPTGLSRALVEEDAVWASGYETVSYGGEGDLWGQAWTIADLEAPGFGNGLRAQYPTPSGNDWAQVDAIGITVFTCP